MKTLAILFTLFYFLNALAVAPYGIKGQNQSVTYPNVYQYPNYSVTGLGGINALIETGNKNILENPSFEAPFFGSAPPSWTSLGMTFNTSALPLSGQKAVRVSMSSSAMAFAQDSGVSQAAFAGGIQCLAMVYVKTTVSGIFVSSRQNSVTSTTNRVAVNNDGKYGLYKVPFICGSGSNGISIHSNGVTVTGDVDVDDAFVGVTNIAQVSSAIGPWTSYTPTFTGFGTVTTIDMKWRQNGPDIEIRGVFTVGTPTATEARISLPNSYTSSTTPALSLAGDMGRTTNASTTYFRHGILAEPSVGYVTIGHQVSAQGLMVKRNGDVAAVTGETFSVNFSVPVTQFSGSVSTYSTPSDSFSTDSNTLTHKTTAIVASDAIGTYNTYSYAINSNTKTICGTAPSTLPTSANGFLIYTRAFNAASTCGNPARIEIKIGAPGDKFPTIKTDIYKSAGKVTIGELDYLTIGTLSQRGMAIKSYSEENGVLVMDAGLNAAVTYTSNDFQFSDATAQTSGFLVINAQKAKDFVVGQFNGLQSCTDTLACTDTFSAEISAAGVVSNENVNWINGNAAITSTSVYTSTLVSGLVTAPLNCVVNTSNGATIAGSMSTSSTTVQYNIINTATTANTASAHKIICQKAGADYIGKTAMAVASDQNVRSIGSTNVDIQSVYFGSGASCTSDCTTGTCTICNQVGSKITSVSFSSTGNYNLNGIDGTKYNCSGSSDSATQFQVVAHSRASSSASLARIVTVSGAAILNARSASVTCVGIP